MFVLAVNGTYETYHPRHETSNTKIDAASPVAHIAPVEDGAMAAFNPSVLAAQHAYGRMEGRQRQRAPVLLARDLMSSPVAGIRPETSLSDAWSLMKAKGFRHLPIVSTDGRLAGIISDRDLLRFANVLERHEHGSMPRSVKDIMPPRVLTALVTTEIREIAQVMAHERISSVPIIDEAYHPVGMLTVTDILRAVVNRAPLELWS